MSWLERKRGVAEDRAVLARIVAVMFAFARLADRAARLPRPLRFILLKILRRGERAGLQLVVSTACDLRAGPWLMTASSHPGNEPDDVIRLAASFRLLALALAAMAALSARFAAPQRPHEGQAKVNVLTMARRLRSGIRARDAPDAVAPG